MYQQNYLAHFIPFTVFTLLVQLKAKKTFILQN